MAASRPPDLARKTFDAIARAQTARTMEELDCVLGGCIREIGFTHHARVGLRGPGGRPRHELMFGNSHPEWERRYIEKGYDGRDLVLREILAGGQPMFWSDITRRRPLQKAEERLYGEAAEFGLKDGFLTPLPDPDGSFSTVILMSGDIEAEAPDLRSAAHLLSLYYANLGAELTRAGTRRNPANVVLSQRQMQCLRWVRHGKSSSDIGDIIGLSTRTVDHYIADACRKLGVRTRTQAVIEASLRAGLDL